jgi:predicted  nucleic acid-binding Zn-ribbon protein
MPHSCAVCGAVFASLAELDGGACPVCHACKFIYEGSEEVISLSNDSLFENTFHESVSRNGSVDAVERESDDDTVSVRIRRPGSYEINLRQMGTSSDRVIGVEKKGVYHLDLLSMAWKKKR